MRAISTPHWRVFDVAIDIEGSPAIARATGPLVEVRVDYERNIDKCTGERCEYALVVEIENIGSVALLDYRVDILFPKAFMDIESYGAEVQSAETATHKLIRRTAASFPDHPNGLFASDKIEDKLIRYSVNEERRFWTRAMGHGNPMQLPVEVTVLANGMAPKRVSKPIRELQDF